MDTPQPLVPKGSDLATGPQVLLNRLMAQMQNTLLPVINLLFLETNPAPVKYALSRMGLCSPEMRLPMWLPTQTTRRKIDEQLKLSEGIFT